MTHLPRILFAALVALVVSVLPIANAQTLGGFASGTCQPTVTGFSTQSVTDVSSAGGAIVITATPGTSFPTGPQVAVCLHSTGASGCGTNSWFTLTILSSSTSVITAVTPALTAGDYDLQVSMRSCAYYLSRSVLKVTSTTDPSVTYSGHLEWWVRSDTGVLCGGSPCTNGGTVDTWTDKSGNGRDLTGSGTARPIYNAACSYCTNPQPSSTFDGINDLMKNTATNVAGSTDLTLFFVGKELTATNGKMWLMWGSSSGASPGRWAIGDSLGFPSFYGSAGLSAQFATAPSGGFQAYGGLHGTSGAYTANISVANASTNTGSSTQAWAAPTTGTVALGGSTDGSTFGNIEVVEAFIVSGINPNSTQLAETAKYLNLRYFNYAPSFSESTVMFSTGTGFRLLGTGASGTQFVSGMTVTFAAALGVSAQTATVVSTTLIEVPMPGSALSAGTYAVTLTNPDGGSITVSSGLTISATASDTPLTATGDLSCVGWYDGSRWSLNGSTVSGFVDQSLRGNTLVQATAANQPARTLADTDFASANSWTLDGVQTYLATSANFDFGATTNAFDAFSVTKVDVSNPSGDLVTGGAGYGQSTSVGKPRVFFGGNTATFASSTGGSVKSILTEMPFGTTQTIFVEVNNAGQVTGTSSPSSTAHAMAIGAYNAGTFGKGKMAVVAVFNHTLTPTQRTNLRAWGVGHYGA